MGIRDRPGDFSVVGPGPAFCHRKTRKIPGGDWSRRNKTGLFLRENSLFVRSGKALFWRTLSRNKMCQNAKKPAGGRRLGRFRGENGALFLRGNDPLAHGKS